MSADLAKRGFTTFGLEGVPAGIVYSGEEPPEQFVAKYLGQNKEAPIVQMISVLHSSGITVIGVDLSTKKMEDFEKYYQPRLEAIKQESEKTVKDMDEFMKLLPFLTEGVNLETDMEKLKAAGITLSPEEIRQIASNPSQLVDRVENMSRLLGEVNREYNRTVIERRDEAMPKALLEAISQTGGKGVLFVGSTHCSNTNPNSAAQRLIQSGLATQVVILTEHTETLSSVGIEAEPAHDSMYMLDDNYWLIYQKEEI